MLFKSKDSKVVFAVFTQHCIQSTVTHFVTHVKSVKSVKYYVLYSVYMVPHSSRREGYLLFEKPFFLWILWFTTSHSKEAALLSFLDLSTTKVIAGKTHTQSPILKTKGVLSNLVILRYLWEQSCILHTLTKLPACNLEPKSVFNA